MLATPYQMKVCAPLKAPKVLMEFFIVRAVVYCGPVVLLATPEPGEDPRVTRAKFFIRDEFLVSLSPFCPFNYKLSVVMPNTNTS